MTTVLIVAAGVVVGAIVLYLLVAVLFAITGWDVGRTSRRRPRR